MADTAVAITAGSGTNIDTRTEGTNGNHRQVVVVGDPATNAGVAPVDATAGLKVDLGADNDVTNAGTFAVQEDGAALTALQLIDDIVYTDDADWTDSTSKHALTGGVYQSTPQSITDGDTGPLQVTANGFLKVSLYDSNGAIVDPDQSATGPNAITTVDSYTTAAVDIAAAGTHTISAPGANKQIWVYGIALKTNGTTATAQIKSDAAGTPVNRSGVFTLTNNDGFVVNPAGNFEMPWIKGSTNVTLDIVTTGSGTVDGIITYAVVDVS